MKRILATTAMSLFLSTAAFADDHMSAFTTYDVQGVQDIYASEFIGMRIYSAEKDYDAFDANSRVNEGAEQEWDDIGEVNDIILGRDGKVKAVILGVGGFLGVGEKDVAVDMSSIKIVNETDDEDDFFLVVKTDRDMLSDAPSFERAMEEGATFASQTGKSVKEYAEGLANDASGAMSNAKDKMTIVATDAKNKMAAATDEAKRTILMAPDVVRDGWNSAVITDLTTDDLSGARVYGANDEDIGEIDALILNDEGKIEKAILDIGGFLGIGEHRIAVTMDELKILRQNDGGEVKVYINATQKALEAQPEYKGS
ncbi:PRC-barrel domain-containing protein [Cohaesibacter celericrescens]|uniref:Photosystem reaction center subunit H n=1 Tax=Cohaesibacter celericrescens TaxID=2067669 RepID=A0A2N5XS42_9HYPH|nr:PRC-barrel domain-containing protein [Cohaesibacter celericrescens]PLW77333.1 photosystem reaction center subunit H [Cohaesibacter celericrescens]